MTPLANKPAGLTRSLAPRLAACASSAILVLALTSLPAFAAHATQVRVGASLANPSANVAPDPNYDGCTESGYCTEGPPCYTPHYSPAFDSSGCEQEELAAINNARAKEGVGQMYLPRNFNSLSDGEQLLAVIDLERVSRGLAPFAGIVASLDGVAQQGAQVRGRPAGTFEDPFLTAGFSVDAGTAFAYRCHSAGTGSYACDGSGNPGASIAAGGQISALDADYGWMYNDGYGASNVDCTTPNAPGCWGHRDNLLGRYPTHTRFISGPAGSPLSIVSRRPAVPVMGVGSLQPNGDGPQGNWTAIFASVTGRTPALLYTWNQALADGAGLRVFAGTARSPVSRGAIKRAHVTRKPSKRSKVGGRPSRARPRSRSQQRRHLTSRSPAGNCGCHSR
jgi:hypothetical protein